MIKRFKIEADEKCNIVKIEGPEEGMSSAVQRVVTVSRIVNGVIEEMELEPEMTKNNGN